MISGGWIYLASLFLSLFFMTLTSAFAESSGHGAAHAGLFDYWVNFAAYALIVYFLLKKPFLTGWSKRRHAIESLFSTASQDLRAARERQELNLKRLANIETEIQALAREIDQESAHEEKLIISAAGTNAEKAMQRARDTARAELRGLELRYQRELTDGALRIAREKLTARIDSQKDRSFRDAALSNIRQLVH